MVGFAATSRAIPTVGPAFDNVHCGGEVPNADMVALLPGEGCNVGRRLVTWMGDVEDTELDLGLVAAAAVAAALSLSCNDFGASGDLDLVSDNVDPEKSSSSGGR